MGDTLEVGLEKRIRENLLGYWLKYIHLTKTWRKDLSEIKVYIDCNIEDSMGRLIFGIRHRLSAAT